MVVLAFLVPTSMIICVYKLSWVTMPRSLVHLVKVIVHTYTCFVRNWYMNMTNAITKYISEGLCVSLIGLPKGRDTHV